MVGRFIRCLSGKVHGSLSRAGKVKSQTPKVEKKEKKKPKTGRAKRRQQYNRRILNANEYGGGKPGPNSNIQKR
ncbi:Dipeptidyl peptidase 1 [Armadillidium vulgare]|nr:Dipeptidyl peptidase 1 [Armadillidium vulgare]